MELLWVHLGGQARISADVGKENRGLSSLAIMCVRLARRHFRNSGATLRTKFRAADENSAALSARRRHSIPVLLHAEGYQCTPLRVLKEERVRESAFWCGWRAMGDVVMLAKSPSHA